MGKNSELGIRRISALYDDRTIRVYQAYNNQIADEALKLGTFGPSLKTERMTWIKPSFLWMMYRSNWGTKVNQERILAIDILRDGFDEILENATLSKFESDIYFSHEQWRKKLCESEARCQWDPEKDIYGNDINKKAIQLGIKGTLVEKYIQRWIYRITDITSEIHSWKEMVDTGEFSCNLLPHEKDYPVCEKIKKELMVE